MMTKSERAEFILSELNSRKTLQYVGNILGLSRERVRQIASELGFKWKPAEKRIKQKRPALPRGRPSSPYKQEARTWAAERGLPDPVRKYYENSQQAKHRGIEWKLSFDQWWELWQPHFHLRGRNIGQKQLCRYLDAGNYEVGNVRVDYGRANIQEHGLVVQMSKPRWMRRRRSVNKTILGIISPFSCQDEDVDFREENS